MRPRRSSLEMDLQAEIRTLRDRLNNLEHNLEVNTRSSKVLYAILCGQKYILSFILKLFDFYQILNKIIISCIIFS